MLEGKQKRHEVSLSARVNEKPKTKAANYVNLVLDFHKFTAEFFNPTSNRVVGSLMGVFSI